MNLAKEVVFCDLAGTLSFQNLHNNMHDATPVGNDLVDLKDPITGKTHRVIETLVQDYKMYTDPETIRLLEQVKKQYHLVYVTGSRPSTIISLSEVLTPPHATLLENGAMIYLNGYGGIDNDWSEVIALQIAELKDFASRLKAEGWIINDRGRTSAARIFPSDNPGRTKNDFEELARQISENNHLLKTSWNLGGMDIMPMSAGKGNAIKYYLSKIGYGQEATVGIGDDINDLEMFEAVRTRLVVRGAHEEILQVARDNNWHISKDVHFDGINELLRGLL